jgi:hypothetical protein
VQSVVIEPPDWFICHFYNQGFPRQTAQKGAYSLTARYGRDHAASIKQLLKSSDNFHLYLLAPQIKTKLQKTLKEDFKIWRGTLFPDSAGAGETAREEVFPV